MEIILLLLFCLVRINTKWAEDILAVTIQSKCKFFFFQLFGSFFISSTTYDMIHLSFFLDERFMLILVYFATIRLSASAIFSSSDHPTISQNYRFRNISHLCLSHIVHLCIVSIRCGHLFSLRLECWSSLKISYNIGHDGIFSRKRRNKKLSDKV